MAKLTAEKALEMALATALQGEEGYNINSRAETYLKLSEKWDVEPTPSGKEPAKDNDIPF